ncbi:cobalamin biosynthesis protein CobD [Methylocystaceae bacterium]|nr:cobalamin biosynthesis protein CobD [Methylocystaceae bacterium]
MNYLIITITALALEASAGYSSRMLELIGHPVTWMGALISALDKKLNDASQNFKLRRLKGCIALFILVITTLIMSCAICFILNLLPLGALLTAIVASSLMALRSLDLHVEAVADGLDVSLEEGRAAVGKIVGRDVRSLDETGVASAAIESLAENFSDGVVAPALYLALFSLPGAAIYKAVNTADSMIGHMSERYEAFGFAAARLDDLLNLVPARVSASLLILASLIVPSASAGRALKSAIRDAPCHLSPNAGWPEAAMAGALGLSIGGPRTYAGTFIQGTKLGDGLPPGGSVDIRRALSLYRRAALIFCILLAITAILSR